MDMQGEDRGGGCRQKELMEAESPEIGPTRCLRNGRGSTAGPWLLFWVQMGSHGKTLSRRVV